MTATRPFVSLFGIDKDADIVKVAVAAVKEGYAVIPIRPASKLPMCTLSEKERNRVGDHPCGVKHAITDETEARRVFTRIAAGSSRPVNIAVVAHASRLIVVDADNEEGVRAFQVRVNGMTPTCRTPGALDDAGNWRHKGGGHFYFAVPEDVSLDPTPGVLSKDGYDIRYGKNYTLVPPSVRPEGLYEPTGEVLPAPPWLIEEVLKHIHDRQESGRPPTTGGLDCDGPIAVWSRDTSWEDLLTADGWTIASMVDGMCGCPVFTRPGGGTMSPRSATGHDNECRAYPNVEGHGPLHLWTTDPPESLKGLGDTMTKLTYYAAMHCDGNVTAASVRLGLKPDLTEWVQQATESAGVANEVMDRASTPIVELEPVDRDRDHSAGYRGSMVAVVDIQGADAEGSGVDNAQRPNPVTSRDERFWERHPDVPGSVRAEVKQRAAEMRVGKLAAEYAEGILSGEVRAYTLRGGPDLAERLSSSGPEAVATVGHRSDGKGLLYPGRISVVAGKPGVGKSWFTLLIAQQCMAAGQTVVLLDFEDSNHLTAQRLRAIGVDVDSAVRSRLLYLADIDGAMTREDLVMLLEEVEVIRPAYVGLDSANAMITMFGDISDNTTVTWVYRELWRSAMRANYAMLIVDHVPNNGGAKRAIGAQAKQASLTGTFFLLERGRSFAEGKEGESLLSFQDKDRPGGVAAYADERSRVGLFRIGPDISDVGEFGTVARLEPVPEGYGTDEEESDPIVDCAAAVMQKLHQQGGEATRNQIRDSVSSKLKKHLEKALKYLEDDGLIEQFKDDRRSMIRRLAD